MDGGVNMFENEYTLKKLYEVINDKLKKSCLKTW